MKSGQAEKTAGASLAGANGSDKRRRRHRSSPNRPGTEPRSPQGDNANRERIFQDIEGLLRQIRELAEEEGLFSEAQVSEFAHAVADLFKSLEADSTASATVSERSFSEYQRMRRRLSEALHAQLDGRRQDASYE